MRLQHLPEAASPLNEPGRSIASSVLGAREAAKERSQNALLRLCTEPGVAHPLSAAAPWPPFLHSWRSRGWGMNA
jgi:hypothetical protein